MKMLQDVTDWFKAEILGDQSLQQERKKLKSQKDFEKRINEAARHVCLSDRPKMMGLHILLSAWMAPLSIKSARILESRKEKSALKMLGKSW